MSLLNSSSGAYFLNLSAYNRFRSFISRRSDSSVSDVESIQSSLDEDQGDPSLSIFLNLYSYNRFRSLASRRSNSSISDAESIQSSQAEEQGSSTGDYIPIPRTEGEILSSPNLKSFTFKELKRATRNFHPDSHIGIGPFGIVFKGWIDEQTFTASKPGVGMVVAVKKFRPESFQGPDVWLTEVRFLGQLHHPNLVKLIGFCLDGENRLLVYEFMPRGRLDSHLFGSRAQSLSWATRIEVAIGVAKGLALLHDAESQVIHRDVKSYNIFLDSDLNAKLSAFGFAMAGPTGDMTHVTTQVAGTYGYIAPEYIATGHLSAKADVYSFGVVLLELLSGCRAIDVSESGTERNLVDWARPYLGDEQKLFRVIDSKLEGQFPKKEAHAMAKLVLVCIANDPKLRPRMSEVLAVLEKLQDP